MGAEALRKVLLGSVSGLALTCAVQAADLPVKAPAAPPVVWSWAGPYLGIEGGVASHRGELFDEDSIITGAHFIGPPTTYRITETGVLFGAHAGYNWQSGVVVYGLEGDIGKIWAKGSKAPVRPDVTTSFLNFDVKWLATIRARLGVLVSQATLLYVTGGVAFGDVRDHAGDSLVRTNLIVDKVKTGWTVGGGIAHKFARNWTARAEVRYAELGKTATSCTPPGGNCSVVNYRGELSNTLLMGLAGVSLKF